MIRMQACTCGGSATEVVPEEATTYQSESNGGIEQAVQAVEGFHLVLEMDYCIYYGRGSQTFLGDQIKVKDVMT